jgi:hypothetical protein
MRLGLEQLEPRRMMTAKPIGIQTYYQPASSYDQIKSTEAYFRYDWSQIEKSPGMYNFSGMDWDYQHARAAGQQFNFRIMPYEEGNSGPTGLTSLGGSWFRFEGSWTFQPNLNLPAVKADLDKLLKALGARYAAGTATVDIGWWGPWGEWSNYAIDVMPPRPTTATTQYLVAETQKYFYNSYAIVQEGVATDDPTTFRMELQMGCGVRWDSWYCKNAWLENEHKASLSMIAATQQWKIAPMILEPWDTNAWGYSDWQNAINQAMYTYHAWMFSTKGNWIPSYAVPWVNQLLSQERLL